MKKLGSRIRSFREKQNLSIDSLATQARITPHMLEAIEKSEISPSLAPLVKIARALGVRLGTFLDDQISKDPLIIKLAEREEEVSTHGALKNKTAMRFFSLGKGKNDRHMEPFFIELLAESQIDPQLSSHEGEEFILVQTGQVFIQYGAESSILKAGDSIYYNSIVPHYIISHGDEPASICAVIYFPE